MSERDEVPLHPPSAPAACVPNIGDRGRRRRLNGGIVWAVAGVAAVVLLRVRAAPEILYAALVIPFTLAALGYFQSRERT